MDEIVDAAVSGTKPLAQRPGGARVAELLNAKSPAADAVVVVRLDRLGRDAAESLALFKRFRTGRVGLVSIAEQVDLATPHGRAMASVQMVFAELEQSLLSAANLRGPRGTAPPRSRVESPRLRLGRRERASGAQRGRAAGDPLDQATREREATVIARSPSIWRPRASRRSEAALGRLRRSVVCFALSPILTRRQWVIAHKVFGVRGILSLEDGLASSVAKMVYSVTPFCPLYRGAAPPVVPQAAGSTCRGAGNALESPSRRAPTHPSGLAADSARRDVVAPP